MKTNVTLCTLFCLFLSLGNFLQSQSVPYLQNFKLQQPGLTSPDDDLTSKLQQHRYLIELQNANGNSRIAWQREQAAQPAATPSAVQSFLQNLMQQPPATSGLAQQASAKNDLVHFRGESMRLDSTYQYDGDPAVLEVPDSKIYYEYDENDRLTGQLTKLKFGQYYLDFTRNLYSYDEKGNLTADDLQFWNNAWEPRQSTQFVYDENGRLIQKTMTFALSPWQDETHELVYTGTISQPDTIYILRKADGVNMSLHQMEVFELNALGQPVMKSTFFKFYNGDIVNFQRTLYQYDGNARLSQELLQFLCYETLDNWAGHHKTNFTYDAGGNLLETLEYNWSNLDLDWHANVFTHNSYDADGNLLSQTIQRSQAQGEKSWVARQYGTQSFSWQGNLLQHLNFQWDGSNNQWKIQDETAYAYNDDGLLAEKTLQISQCAESLYNSAKHTFGYDETGRVNDSKVYSWDFDLNVWKTESMVLSDFEYDANGNIVEETVQNWVAGNWSYSHTLKTYDEAGKLTETILEFGSPGNWQPGHRFTYDYYPNGKIKEEAGHYYTAGGWLKNARTTFVYYENGHLQSETYEYLSGNNWVNVVRWLYAHDESGQLTEEVQQNFQNNAWKNNTRLNYTYDANGHLTEFSTAYFSNENWVNSTRITHAYNGLGLETSSTDYWWNFNTESWSPSLRVNTIYDKATLQPVEFLTENFEHTNFAWDINQHRENFWNALTPAFSNAQNSLDCFMSNPYVTGSSIVCDGLTRGKLSVYDVLGRLRLEQSFSGQTAIHQRLEAGSYFFVIRRENGETARRKILVR